MVAAQEDPPVRPLRDTEEDLGFKRQGPVQWLAPPVLVRTGIKVLASSLFGNYLDKRELQIGFKDGVKPHGGPDGLWLDYVADIGDGFNATYTVASVLARTEVTVEGEPLPRGEVLVFGGDQVYPYADTTAYEDRSKGPYRAALPAVAPGTPPPTMYALPGNHDWYDGLTAFLRIFGQKRHVGAWNTAQARSYFALKLPGDWWLLAVDSQSDGYLDEPQRQYFKEAVTGIEKDHGVILCWSSPVWVDTEKNPQAYDPVEFFRREILPDGPDIRLMLSGDLHHYARYAEQDTGVQRITCGLGGAYLAATHHLPEDLVLPPRSRTRTATPQRTSTLETRYPDRRKSALLTAGILQLPFRNWLFTLLQSGLHTVFLATLVYAFANVPDGVTAANFRTNLTIGNVWSWFPSALFACVMLYAGVLFAKGDGRVSPWRYWPAGLLHGAAQIALGAGYAALVWHIPQFGSSWPTGLGLVLLSVVGLILVGILATELVAVYLLFASLFGVNVNEAFAGRGHENYKGFLRLHIDPHGLLTVYAIKIPQACRKWVLNPHGVPTEPWLVPARGTSIDVELIEKIEIRRERPTPRHA